MFLLLLRAHVEPLICVFFFVVVFWWKKTTTQNSQCSLPIINYPWQPVAFCIHTCCCWSTTVPSFTYGCSRVNAASQQICVLFFSSCQHHTMCNIFFLYLKQLWSISEGCATVLCTVVHLLTRSGDATLSTTVYRDCTLYSAEASLCCVHSICAKCSLMFHWALEHHWTLLHCKLFTSVQWSINVQGCSASQWWTVNNGASLYT